MKRMTITGIVPLCILMSALFLSLSAPQASAADARKTRVAVIDFEQKWEQEFRGKQV